MLKSLVSRLRAEAPSREDFLRDGYVVVPDVLPRERVEAFRALSRRITAARQTPEYVEKHRSIGSLFDILEEPAFAQLIAWPAALRALADLGFDDVRYQHGILFNKPPHTPATFWHQDGTMWGHPVSYEPQATDIVVIYYLVATHPGNGALRVIPGSHRRRHVLHDHLKGSYTPELRRMDDPGSAAFRTFDDEVTVAVAPGDMVVIDARLLHAAHANGTSHERTAVSLWYLPSYRSLPECVKARFDLKGSKDARVPFLPEEWPEAAKARLRPLLPPAYAGTEQPLALNNTPDERLA